MIPQLEEILIATINDYMKEHGAQRTGDIINTVVDLLIHAAATHISSAPEGNQELASMDVLAIAPVVKSRCERLARSGVAERPSGKPN